MGGFTLHHRHSWRHVATNATGSPRGVENHSWELTMQAAGQTRNKSSPLDGHCACADACRARLQKGCRCFGYDSTSGACRLLTGPSCRLLEPGAPESHSAGEIDVTLLAGSFDQWGL